MQNLDTMWYDTVRMLMGKEDTPSRLGPTKEVLGYRRRLDEIWMNIIFNPVRKFSMSYACAEMLWYLSGTDTIDLISAYAPSYKNYVEEDGTAWGPYGNRWATNCHQLDVAYDILSQDHDSRQAVMTMYNYKDLLAVHEGGKKDIPCTLTLQFLIREEKLHLITNMRSNDCWIGFPYDVFCFSTLQRIMAEMLGVGFGSYIHQSGSEHIYERHYEKANGLIRYDVPQVLPPPREQMSSNWQIPVVQALHLEKEGRLHKFDMNSLSSLPPVYRDLVLGCWGKWDGPDQPFCNEYYEAFRETQR